MKRRFAAPVCLALLFFNAADVPVPVAARAADITSPGHSNIPRFSQVGERLYRGGQPGDEDFAFLRSIGIRTIISLREEDGERKRVESLGMKFVHIPVTFTPFARTTVPRQAVEKFFQVLDDPASGLVFVHCQRGADRTGTFVGLYRMLRENWDAQRAYDEARKLGMRWWFFGIKDQLETLSKALTAAAAEAKAAAAKKASNAEAKAPNAEANASAAEANASALQAN